MDIDKLFESNSLDGIADNVFGVVNNSVSEVKEMQRKKVAENVQLVVNALKKIESDISSRYDSVGNALEKRIITIKDGRDGADGRDGRNGKDGKNGRDGAPGPRGADGKNGLDGADGTDGVSVTNAHIDFDGSLVISLSSGQELNVGEVVAPALAEQIKVITNGGGTSQSVIDTLASLQAQITAISGASIYKGLWNASTNTPTLTSSVGTSGNFYIVSVAGSTNLDGITNWGVGDWAIYNGTAWQRVEGGAAGNFTTVTASSLTSGRVTYAGTAGLLQDSANLTFNGTTLTANTIGAFTLSGTVAGGGNQLNNVIIGTTTPLAGAFTTLSATKPTTIGDVITFTSGAASSKTGYLYVNTTSVALSGAPNGGSGMCNISLSATGLTLYGPDQTKTAVLDNTGLAVTGTLSATGNITTNTSVGGVLSLQNTSVEKVYISGGASYNAFSLNQTGIGTTSTNLLFATSNVINMTLDTSGSLGLKVTPSGSSAGAFTQLQIGGSSGLSTFYGQSNDYACGLASGAYFNSSSQYVYASSTKAVSNIYAYNGSTKIQYAASGTAGNTFTPTTIADFTSTGLAVTGTLSSTLDATIYGLTVGRGGGSILTNTAFGSNALQANTSGTSNVAIGNNALKLATITLGNTAVGSSALAAYARTASVTGRNTAIGQAAMSSNTDGVNNTAVGYNAFSGGTGSANTCIGLNSGSGITSGNSNVILGAYAGSTAPISATGSNYIVLSDGDGNVRGTFDSSGNLLVGTTTNPSTIKTRVKATNGDQLELDNAGDQFTSFYLSNNGTIKVSSYWDNTNAKYQIVPVTNGVYLSSGGVAWVAVSDERFKDIIEPIENATDKLSGLRAIVGKYKTDEEGIRRSFLIAQDVQAVFPEAVDSTNQDELGLRYQDLIPVLVKAIQELSAKVAALEAK